MFGDHCTQLLLVVVFSFLLMIGLLVRSTRRITAKWHTLETEARLAAALLVDYGRAVLDEQRVAKRGCHRCRIMLAKWLPCAPRRRVAVLEEQVVYASLRARFIRPSARREQSNEVEDSASPMSALVSPSSHATPVDLCRQGARRYRHKSALTRCMREVACAPAVPLTSCPGRAA